jgi:hypothetical protein
MIPIHPVVLEKKFVLLLLFGPIENPRWLPAGDII